MATMHSPVSPIKLECAHFTCPARMRQEEREIEEEPQLKPGGSQEDVESRVNILWEPQVESNVELELSEQELRRTRRLLSMFNFWRSKTEMQQVASRASLNLNLNSYQQPEQNSVRESEVSFESSNQMRRNLNINSNSNSNPSQAATMSNQIMFVPTCTLNMPFSTNIMPDNLNEAISERKLWQSLVMPLVLGCLIFLVVVWTRQISLVLLDDTVVMIFILGSVFILMSGIAFWLAQDQSVGQTCNQNQTENSSRRSSRHSCGHNRYQEQSNLNKRCDLSTIECQPPDYYSALRDSFPVDVYLKQELSLGENKSDQNETQPSENHPPPSYTEWSRVMLETKNNK